MATPPTLTQIAARKAAIRRGWCDSQGVILQIEDRRLPVLACVCDTCGDDLPDGVVASHCSPCMKLLNSGRLNEDRVYDYLTVHGPSTSARIGKGIGMDPSGVRRVLRRQMGKRFRRLSTKPKHAWEAIP